MKLLDKSEYNKVAKLLTEVAINSLLFRFVAEQKVNGLIYTDDTDEPCTFYIIHPYGMSLLFGETGNHDFNRDFLKSALNLDKVRNKPEWLQAYPGEWDKVLGVLFRDHLKKTNDGIKNQGDNNIEVNTRVNFKFNKEKYLDFKDRNVKNEYKILRTDKNLCESMQGSVVPMCFWNDADHFCNDGVGYSLIYEDRLVSTAFSACILDDKLELGIETTGDFKGKGFAKYTCSSLIDYCLENNYEPVWACRLENTGSYRLAQSLGFEPTVFIPYYRLIC